MEDIQWFHSIPFPDGTMSDGVGKYENLKACADLVFKFPLAGKSVLDIGAWDGFFSFEAEKRGAKRVLATDYFVWEKLDRKDGFDFAYNKIQSKVEKQVIDLPDLTVENIGKFDTVLFLGVLYHLKDPMVQLERLLPLAKELFMIETLTTANDLDRPVLQYLPGRSVNNDPTNFFAPNLLALTAMLADLGYTNIEYSTIPMVAGFDRVVTTVYTCPIHRIITL